LSLLTCWLLACAKSEVAVAERLAGGEHGHAIVVFGCDKAGVALAASFVECQHCPVDGIRSACSSGRICTTPKLRLSGLLLQRLAAAINVTDHALGHMQGVLDGGVGQQGHKFIAAESSHQIAGAQQASGAASDQLECLVSGSVTTACSLMLLKWSMSKSMRAAEPGALRRSACVPISVKCRRLGSCVSMSKSAMTRSCRWDSRRVAFGALVGEQQADVNRKNDTRHQGDEHNRLLDVIRAADRCTPQLVMPDSSRGTWIKCSGQSGTAAGP
jgi:hypothetical protein